MVECRRDVRPSLLPLLAERQFSRKYLPKGTVPVLAAPWISPRVAERCRELGWSWFDLAGNCRLEVPGLFLLERTGREPVVKRPRPEANLSTPEAARVMRALLAPENAGMRWTQRELKDRCRPQVSIGLVNKLVRYLREEAFAEEATSGGFQVRDPVQLLMAWQAAYRFERNRRINYFTLLQGPKLRDALDGIGVRNGMQAAYAAFSAAEFQAPTVRQPKTWLYIGEENLDLFEQQLEAKSVDSGENVVVLVSPDDGVFYLPDTGANNIGLACTNPVQTYVDLLSCGGRGQEAAEALLKQRLKPAWERKVNA